MPNLQNSFHLISRVLLLGDGSVISPVSTLTRQFLQRTMWSSTQSDICPCSHSCFNSKKWSEQILSSYVKSSHLSLAFLRVCLEYHESQHQTHPLSSNSIGQRSMSPPLCSRRHTIILPFKSTMPLTISFFFQNALWVLILVAAVNLEIACPFISDLVIVRVVFVEYRETQMWRVVSEECSQ